ncbi:MAG: hypothetical protein KC657_35910, partial [Myxococcales bacterium]|nr:hypothetical protein [Myxococcales bacterium]
MAAQRRSPRWRYLLFVSAAAGLVACSLGVTGLLEQAPVDAGVDATPEASLPPGFDASSDVDPGDGGALDADAGPPVDLCPAVCADAGIGTCDAGTCVIDCDGPGSACNKNVVCPAGTPCDVTCGE